MSLFKRKEESLPTPEQAGLSEKATEAAKAAVMQAKRYLVARAVHGRTISDFGTLWC